MGTLCNLHAGLRRQRRHQAKEKSCVSEWFSISSGEKARITGDAGDERRSPTHPAALLRLPYQKQRHHLLRHYISLHNALRSGLNRWTMLASVRLGSRQHWCTSAHNTSGFRGCSSANFSTHHGAGVRDGLNKIHGAEEDASYPKDGPVVVRKPPSHWNATARRGFACEPVIGLMQHAF